MEKKKVESKVETSHVQKKNVKIKKDMKGKIVQLLCKLCEREILRWCITKMNYKKVFKSKCCSNIIKLCN